MIKGSKHKSMIFNGGSVKGKNFALFWEQILSFKGILLRLREATYTVGVIFGGASIHLNCL